MHQDGVIYKIIQGCTVNKTYHVHVPIALKSRSFNLLEPSGPVQAYNGIAFTVDRLEGNKFVSILGVMMDFFLKCST